MNPVVATILKYVGSTVVLGLVFWFGLNYVISTTKKQCQTENALVQVTAQQDETVRVVTEERSVTEYVTKKTDADLARMLDWWMLPAD